MTHSSFYVPNNLYLVIKGVTNHNMLVGGVLVGCEECYNLLIGLLLLFCLPLLLLLSINMHTKNTTNELARLVMGTIFLVYIYIY